MAWLGGSKEVNAKKEAAFKKALLAEQTAFERQKSGDELGAAAYKKIADGYLEEAISYEGPTGFERNWRAA